MARLLQHLPYNNEELCRAFNMCVSTHILRFDIPEHVDYIVMLSQNNFLYASAPRDALKFCVN